MEWIKSLKPTQENVLVEVIKIEEDKPLIDRESSNPNRNFIKKVG